MDVEAIDRALSALVELAAKPTGVSDKTGVANLITSLSDLRRELVWEKRELEREEKENNEQQ